MHCLSTTLSGGLDRRRRAINFVIQAMFYLPIADNWTGPVELVARALEQLEYTTVMMEAWALLTVPVGLLIGHVGHDSR